MLPTRVDHMTMTCWVAAKWWCGWLSRL